MQEPKKGQRRLLCTSQKKQKAKNKKQIKETQRQKTKKEKGPLLQHASPSIQWLQQFVDYPLLDSSCKLPNILLVNPTQTKNVYNKKIKVWDTFQSSKTSVSNRQENDAKNIIQMFYTFLRKKKGFKR